MPNPWRYVERDKPISPGRTHMRSGGSAQSAECLDRVIALDEGHLRGLLAKLCRLLQREPNRIHRSLDKDSPLHRAIERVGIITS
jgi:hypothetical protein